MNNNDALPVYLQIYNTLKKKIESAEIIKGSYLPSENELSQSFDVSRITIRSALKKLEDSGYIKKEQGKRTIVLGKPSVMVAVNLEDFLRDFSKFGEPLKSVILKKEYVQPSDKIKKILKLDDNEKVFCLERIRTLKGVKVVYSKSYIVNWVNIRYDSVEFNEDMSLKSVFKENNIQMMTCDETLEAAIPNKSIKTILELDNETAVFYRERITYDENERPFEFSTNHYNANYYKYYIEKGKV